MELTILMPCLNEAETLAVCVQKAKSFLEREHIEGEVLIADNGSTDGSQVIARNHAARVIDVPVRGYGAALIAGINEAKGKYIIMGDADDSYDFVNLMPFVKKLREGNDLVMGNRFAGGIKPGAMPFLNKYLGNPVLSFVGRLFFKSAIGDFHCGLRGFNRDAMRGLNLQTLGMEFASEMVVKATLKKLKITEVPTVLSPDGRSRPPHLRKWRDGWRHLKFLLLFSPRWLFLYPGLFLAAIGLVFMTILAAGSLRLGAYQLGIQTMLFAGGFFIIGLQSVMFGVFCKTLAVQRMKLPVSRGLDRFLQQFSLEKGIVFGGALIALGVLGSFSALWVWAQNHFGALIPVETMRMTIPSVIFLVAGVQIIFASFFMSFVMMDCSGEKAND